MKTLKLIFSLIITLVTGAMLSCTTDDAYTPGEVPAGPQVSFSNENITSIDITGDAGEESPKIILTRVVTKGELEVKILSNANKHLVEEKADTPEGGDSTEGGTTENPATRAESTDKQIFIVPGSVTFKDGESTAELVITVAKPEALVEDKVYDLQFQILDNVSTPYGANSWTLDVKLFPWSLIVDEKTGAEKGKFRGGDVFSGGFEVNSVLAEIDVEVYKHKTKEGMFLVKDPWANMVLPTFGIESVEALPDSDIAYTPANLIINCVEPKKCYIVDQTMGLDFGEGIGELRIASDYHPEKKPTGIAGSFEDGVLTWPKEGLTLEAVGAKKTLPTNVNGAFRLVLPGCEAVDYALTVAYNGIVAPSLKEVKAQFAFTYGNDVTGIKYYFAEGNVLSNPTAAIEALLNGQAEDIRSIEEFEKGRGSYALATTIANAGVYTIVAAPMDKSGNLVEKFVALDSFFYTGIGDMGSHPCEVELTLGKYIDYATEEEAKDTNLGDHNAIGYNIKGKSIKSLSVGCWLTSELNEHISKEGDSVESYQKLFAASNVKTFTIEELGQINSENGKGGIFTALKAESNYTVVALALNDYEESDVQTSAVDTGVAPPYAGELKLGKYHWKYEKKDTSFESVIELESYQGSSKEFLVSNIGGYKDNAKWYAIYDAENKTLTLDGRVLGREKEGNLFGVIFGKMADDSEYMYISVAAKNSAGKNNDPLTFTINDNKELSGITNKKFQVLTRKDGKNSTYCQFDNTDATSIVPYVESGENPGGENTGGENPGGENPGGENPGGENPGGENPGGENPGGENPGGENPGGENPGGENTGGENK